MSPAHGTLIRPGRPRREIPHAALCEVCKGAPIGATAQKYAIGLGTLSQYCAANGVKSSHKMRGERSFIQQNRFYEDH